MAMNGRWPGGYGHDRHARQVMETAAFKSLLRQGLSCLTAGQQLASQRKCRCAAKPQRKEGFQYARHIGKVFRRTVIQYRGILRQNASLALYSPWQRGIYATTGSGEDGLG